MSTDKKTDAIAEKLQDGLEDVKAHLDSKLDKYEADMESLQSKMDEQAKNSGEVAEELKSQYTKLEQLYTSQKERIDAYEKANGRLGKGGKEQNFKEVLRKGLEDNHEALKSYKNSPKTINIELDMDMKATMTQGNNLTGTVIEPTRVPGVQYDPERRVRVRNFLPQGNTNSNAIWYVQETAFTDNTDVVAEGNEKPQNDLDLEQKSAAVTKIAATFKVSEEMLDDISYLSSHIGLRGTEKYFNKEDQQILYGTGLSNQLEGLTVSSTDYTLDEYTGDANAQEYDVLIQACKQLKDANYMPTAAMVSVNRFTQMIQRKDADGRYIMPDSVIFGSQTPMVRGVPIIETNALSDDDFLVADFPMLTTLFDRTGINVRFYDQNEDDAKKNLVLVVIEGRLALPTYLPNAGRYGDFATAITNAGNS